MVWTWSSDDEPVPLTDGETDQLLREGQAPTTKRRKQDVVYSPLRGWAVSTVAFLALAGVAASVVGYAAHPATTPDVTNAAVAPSTAAEPAAPPVVAPPPAKTPPGRMPPPGGSPEAPPAPPVDAPPLAASPSGALGTPPLPAAVPKIPPMPVDDATSVILASNEYDFAGQGYPFISKGGVAEPFRPTKLSVQAPAGWTIASREWSVIGPSGEHDEIDAQSDEALQPGASSESVEVSLEHTFRELGPYIVNVSMRVSKWGASETTSWTVERDLKVLYVRRNMLTLSDEDRERFLDAFQTLQHMTADDCVAKFGLDCRPLAYFVNIHLQLAGGRGTDKLHDGMGFLSQHVGLTSSFERSLQSIDPRITVPYWDFTKEGGMVRLAQHVSVAWETELWTDKWFGNSTGPEHTVTEGRFAYQVVPRDPNTTEIRNPYGYLRAPWNVNKAPYVTRVHKFCGVSVDYNNWPSCETHYNLTFSYPHFYDWVWYSGYEPHGPIHELIGGYTNCGNFGKELENITSPAASKDFAAMMVVLPKQLYRAFFANSPTCSMDTPQEDCHMICAESSSHDSFVDSMMKLIIDFTNGAGTTGISGPFSWLRSLDKEQARHLVRIMCTTPFTPGEHIEAASPVDVSFWPIHPTLDRLYQYKRIVDDFTTMDWENAFGDTLYCNQGISEYYAELNGFYNKCEGHHAVDIVPFDQRVFGDDYQIEHRLLTNAELLNAADPNDYKLTYIYDSFRWDHCALDGVHFPTLDWATA